MTARTIATSVCRPLARRLAGAQDANGSSPQWSPSSLGADLGAYWEAAPANYSGGTLTDLSGNGVNLVQADSAKRPVLTTDNGKSVLQSDGVDDILENASFSRSLNDGYTMWALVRQTAPASGINGGIQNIDVVSASLMTFVDAQSLFFYGPNGVASVIGSGVTGWNSLVFIFDNANDVQKVRINGLEQASTANTNNYTTLGTGIQLFGRAGVFTTMMLRAAGVHCAPLAGANLTALETYLAGLTP